MNEGSSISLEKVILLKIDARSDTHRGYKWIISNDDHFNTKIVENKKHNLKTNLLLTPHKCVLVLQLTVLDVERTYEI